MVKAHPDRRESTIRVVSLFSSSDGAGVGRGRAVSTRLKQGTRLHRMPVGISDEGVVQKSGCQKALFLDKSDHVLNALERLQVRHRERTFATHLLRVGGHDLERRTDERSQIGLVDQ